MRKALYILISFCLIGCATFHSSYVDSVSPEYESVNLSKKQKKEVTFSVNLHQQMNEEMFLTQESVAEKIKDTLVGSKLYSKVKWVTPKDSGPLHYHFSVKITGPSPADQIAVGMLAGYTLLLIPTWETYNIDMTMFVLKNGKEVYSVSIPTKAVDVIWLPFVVFTPFLNHGTARLVIKNRNMNYFMNEIIENKLYQ